jgi:hypothetical protein
MGLEVLEDLMGILIADQAATDLGHRFGRDDCLRARPGPAAQQPVDFQRGPCGHSLAKGEVGFAPGSRDARRLQQLLIAHVGLGHLGPLDLGQGHHVVVEAGNGDAVIGVVQRGEDFDQGQRRIVHRAAVEAAVQIIVRTDGLDLDVGHAAQAMGNSWCVYRGHR